MCCNSKYRGFVIGTLPNGKKDIKITPINVHHLELVGNDYIYCMTKKIFHFPAITESFEIPCGHCPECNSKYSKMWADRCLLEMQFHNTCYFVTLTYDDEHLNEQSLNKRDWQLFMKRLRKDQPHRLMFFMCGEYGNLNLRKHYHAIIYDLELPPDDLIEVGTSKSGYPVHISPYLERVWKNGRVTCEVANWNTVCYTARYCTKKLYGDDTELYEQNNLLPPFTLCSKRPAIGLKWFELHPDYLYDFAYLPMPDGNGNSVRITTNRYFDKRMELYNPDKLSVEKIRRINLLKSKNKIIKLTTDATDDTIRSNKLNHLNLRKECERL